MDKVIKKSDVIDYCKMAVYYLDQLSENWLKDYCEMKTIFYTRYQNGHVFYLGRGNFFEEVLNHVIENKPLPNIGQYEKNFNKWLSELKD